MLTRTGTCETASAVVQQMNPYLVVCRYHPGARVDAQAVKENLDARMQFPGKDPYAVMAIFPEDVSFEMSLLEKDHFSKIALNKVTRVLAIVAEGALFESIAKLYFAFYPTRFATAVFPTEKLALTWTRERIEARKLMSVIGV